MRLLTAVLIFASLIFTYASLTSDFPMLEDDGLFILGAWDAGTAHAPGYPLFILLSQPFLLLPFGTVAFQVHLVNGVLGALTCSLLYLYLVRQLKTSPQMALTASLGLAFSNLFFNQALIAEAYMLNVFLLMCLIFIPAIKHTVTARFLLAGFIYGLALSNHWPLTLLMTPALLAIYWPMRNTLKQHALPSLFVAASGLFCGLLPYLWMYTTSSDKKFSHMGSFENAAQFLGFVLREVYANVDQSTLAGVADKLLFLEAHAFAGVTQYSWLALPLIFAGFVRQWRVLPRHLAIGFSLSLLIPASLVILLDFTYQPAYVAASLAYPLPLYFIMAIWLCLGMAWLCEKLPRRTHLIVGVLVVGSIIFQNRDVPEENDSSWSRDIALQIIYALPQDAVLFVSNNWSMAQISYLHYVDGVRPDIDLISEYGAFLPERFHYFLPDAEKSRILNARISDKERPVHALAPLRMVDVPTTDLGLVYAINSPMKRLPATDLLSRVPKGNWNQLYWQELVDRNIHEFDLEQVQTIDDVKMTLTYSRHLMQSDFDPELVADLLSSVDSVISKEDRFTQAKHARLKGDLMVLTENEEIAAEFYKLANRKLPIAGINK